MERARALYLGAAGRLALVRCGYCGRRNCFDRGSWRWLEVAFCRRCWQGVRFEGLVMVSRWEGERLLMENEAFGGELRALREVERITRGFLAYYDSQPYWEWSPRTRGTAAELRRSVALAESMRSRRGGGAEVAQAPRPEAAAVPLTEEEARALEHLALLPEATRADVLEYLERMSRPAGRRPGDEGEVRTSALPRATMDEDEEEGDEDG
ncbi:MAG TPA: hypothetical protein VIP46_20820 [Pyrinomonadaceae bacterium]